MPYMAVLNFLKMPRSEQKCLYSGKLLDITIYTDGSCSPNPGPGGWAALLLFTGSGKVIELQGAEVATTNNRMELQAALSAMESLQESCSLEIITDSKYLQRGVSEWLERWKKKQWRTAEGLPVKNRDLWEKFALELERHEVCWKWVKGHGADPCNIRVDELAAAARKSLPAAEVALDAEAIHLYPGVTWKNSTGCGAWAVVLRYHHHCRILGRPAADTTANKLYLVAVIEGIRALKRVLPVLVYTRFGYLRDGLQTWMEPWRKRGWQTREGKEVSNKEQWMELARLRQEFAVTIVDVSEAEPPCHSQEAKELAREFEGLQTEV
jgi:ribonuclease HI